MLQKTIFSNVLKAWSILVLSGALLSTLPSSASWSMEDPQDCFQKLPKRLTYHLFSFLPAKDLGKLSRVSKGIKSLAEANECWERFGCKTRAEYIKSNQILFTVFNSLPEEEFEMEFACEGRGHRATNPRFYFEAYSATLKFKSQELTIVRLRDLPQEISVCGYDKFYGITKFPGYNASTLTDSIPLIGVWEDKEFPCQKGHEVDGIYDIKKINPLFLLYRPKNYFSTLIAHITENKKEMYEYYVEKNN